MKTLVASLILAGSIISVWAATTIDPANQYACGANLGWMDWRGDTANGTVIGEYVCSSYIYAANVGWIDLGSGSPANGIRYLNLAANDFGVNQDGLGNLRGYAYGANIGWIAFESTGAPTVDLKTGKLSGYVYSANCGWISLSNAFAFVQTDTIAAGADTDNDGIADAWELLHFGNLTTANGASDTDHDGVSDLREYLADTDPNDPSKYLRITAFSTVPGGTTNALTWTSELTRRYYIKETLSLNPPATWYDSGLSLIGPDGALTTRGFIGTNALMRFFRVEAVKPLSP